MRAPWAVVAFGLRGDSTPAQKQASCGAVFADNVASDALPTPTNDFNMPTPAPLHLVWLDPFHPLAPTEQAQERAAVLVLGLGLGSDVPLLVDSLQLIEEASSLPVKFRKLLNEEGVEPFIGHLKADRRTNSCHLKGLRRRQPERGTVRCGRQHPLVAANDHQKRGRPFLAAVAGSGFDRFHRIAVQVTADLDCQTD